jgi:hypothetical protein
MHGHAPPLRDGANRFEQVLVALGARFDVHHDVRRDNLRDPFFHCLGRCMGLFKAGRARHAEGHVYEIALTRAAHADTFGMQDAFGFIHGSFDTFAQSVRGHVQQRIRGAFSQARADPDNHASHTERRDGVQPTEPFDSQAHAQPRSADAQNDDEGAPHVGGKMQCVRFQSIAGIFFQHAV